MRTSNPVLSDRVFEGVRPSTALNSDVMTIDGTVNKCIIAIGITIASASYTFTSASLDNMTFVFVIAAFIMAIVVAMKPSLAGMLVVPYAVTEGLFLGILSRGYEIGFPGLPLQAFTFTAGTLLVLLLAYKQGFIRVTDTFKRITRLGVLSFAGIYLLSLILYFCGMPMTFIHDASPLSIGFSVLAVVVASMCLLSDFDFIENAAKSGTQEKYMEWYGAFALLVSLVWLYIEILRLLAKLQSRD